MAAAERSVSSHEPSEVADPSAKTVFNILSNLKGTCTADQSESFESRAIIQLETDEDILILRKDPKTNQNTINKSAYLKLHRSLSPNRNSTIEKLKEKYENTDDEKTNEPVTVSEKPETIESIKKKYSPSGLGYTKPQPAPKPRRSKLTRSQIILPVKKEQAKAARLSLNIERNKQKDVNSNTVRKESEADENSEDEFVTIITRSDSEESILRFQKELSAFTMDKKKRTNSFRKIFSVFSNKDKKKTKEESNKLQQKENGDTFTDNIQNENNSFNRQAPYRHTIGAEAKSNKPISNLPQKPNGDSKVPNQYKVENLDKNYAQIHINKFNRVKQNFEDPNDRKDDLPVIHSGYTPMDKPFQKSNNTTNTYMNMPNVRKYIDTSSSTSTLESERSNVYQNDNMQRSNQLKEEEVELRAYSTNSFRPNRISDDRRDTPPRLLETKQDVRLVNPKALIPINSERPLPNPYQNGNRDSPMRTNKPLAQSTPPHEKLDDSRPYLNETYGTVFDSIEKRQLQVKPRSPSVEATKLKLPPNREILSLSPRIRSPIPPDDMSTEKIIATELLKPKRSPTPTKKSIKEDIPSHQKLEIDIDYPDNLNYTSRDNLMRSHDNIITKPPLNIRSTSRRPAENTTVPNSSASVNNSNNDESITSRNRISQSSPVENTDRIITNAQVHVHSPINRTPTPNNSLSNQNISLSPVRPANINISPSTPSGSQILESPKTTPQKEDMRKSVEAYYWKEIKKLKDQENYELYLLQMQYGNRLPYGYAEDPISVRRSRSMSPTSNRNGRRSLSLPREVRPPTNVQERFYPNPIPENRAVTNHMQPRSVQQMLFQQQQQQQQQQQNQYFQRNTHERSTVDGSPRKYDGNTNSLYRPIFKRGSLSTPPRQLIDDSLRRKVSFSGSQDQNIQAWPTKNGFTQSPPQRRIDKLQSQTDDDVFLPNTPKAVTDNRYQFNDTSIRSDLPNEEIYYNTRQNIIAPNHNNVEPLYVLRANQNSLYIHQRQPVENPYGQKINTLQRRMMNQPEEVLYGQPVDVVKPPILSRHGSIQMQDELYGQLPRRGPYQQIMTPRPSVPSTPVPVGQEVQYVSRRPPSQQGPPRREIIVNDDIFGQFGGFSAPNNNIRVVQNLYASRQSVAEYNSRVRDDYRSPPKQVSVSNKVCDIYGQIHDTEPSRLQQSGVLMGQLHQNPGSPAVVRNSYTQLAGRDNFVRNSRLTASANDMYRRIPQPYPHETVYGRIDPPVQNMDGPPNRPLPPVPQKKGPGKMRNNLVSDTESGSDASEIQRILNNSSKSKKRGIFGK